MNKIYFSTTRKFLLGFFFVIMLCSNLNAQAFDQSDLDTNGFGTFNGVTAMMFGPDGRLYVAEYPGLIKVLTIQRNSSTDYEVIAMETLNGIQTMADHDDDGSSHTSTERQITGITVVGTAVNPVVYVTSSDFRHGGGFMGQSGDIDLDTNSGVITRFTNNGATWDVVDLVRGLPRSEENHSTNGLEFATISGVDYLIVAQGGNTNGGAPSNNFVFQCEYALSGAVLSIDLNALNALPILNDAGRSYIYDLPTMDDPTRANVNGITDPNATGYDGIDVNDPFGGNDGLNQAIVETGGPVQIFSPGYRNAYDLTITESGALYVTDNGANGGWGGFPVNEGLSGTVTNDYDPTEPGSQSPSGGEIINNEDHLQLVTTNIQTYVPGSYYGGHPNPTRANPTGAGLYTSPALFGNVGAEFRTLTYDPDGSTPGSTMNQNVALPANWPPVATANAVEGDWRGPGIANPDGPVDGEVTIWNTNTNGMDEYTASNFGGAMQGNLLATSDSQNVRRVQLDGSGMLQNLDETFLSGLGGWVLGITCNSDTDNFPGTIWAGTYSTTTGKIVVFEPADFICIEPGQPGYDANADYDNDGYTNLDEELNGTDACNGGSQPNDFDKLAGGTLVSDLNDLDDDNDGILDANDPFQLGNISTTGSDAFTIPITNELFNEQQGLGGIFGLGLTGLMNNGNTGPNWLDWLDVEGGGPNPDDVLGGAIGLMTSHMTSGTALGATNTQTKAYQYGVISDATIGDFTVAGNLVNLTGPLRLYGNSAAIGGELGYYIGDGTQSNYIKIVITEVGITALQEINDIPQTPINVTIPVLDRPTLGVVFYFVIDPSNGEVDLEYEIDGGARVNFGTITAQGAILTAIQQANQDLAVGLIGTSNTTGVELEGSWDFLRVLGEEPVIVKQLPDVTRVVNDVNDTIDLDDYFDDDNGVSGLVYTVFTNTNPAVGASIPTNSNILTLSYPANPATSSITIRATDADTFFVDNTFNVTVTEAGLILYRVNSGGPQITAIDGALDWEADTTTSNSQYLSQAGSNNFSNSTITIIDGPVDQATTPLSIFETERYDANPAVPNMTYTFPVTQSGNYEVRLYMGNSFGGTSQQGQRVFDVTIEGVTYPALDHVDLSGTYGHQVGTVISHILTVSDGNIDISFPHVGPENPLVNAIEIIDASDADTPIYVDAIANQFNSQGDVISGLSVLAFGGDGALQYSASGFPGGININTNGQITGTIGAGVLGGTYNVSITVDDTDGSTSDTASVSFDWIIGSNLWVDKNENQNYTARHECSFVQAGDKFFLMGGRESAQTVDIYDYTSDSWVNLVASAPKEFNHFQATEYQGLIWVIGAFQNNTFPSETPAEFIWAFDPSNNEWIQGPQIPVARRRGSTGLIVQNNKFYIVGGSTNGHDGGYVAWFDEYDPATGVWTALADAPRARDHFSATLIGDNLYLAGGRLSGGAGGVFAPTVAEVDVYNFGSGTWSTLAQNIPTPRAGASTANFNGNLLVIGGEIDGPGGPGVAQALAVTEEYDPATQTWTTLADLNNPRHGTQAIVSGSGVFILAGSPVQGGGNQKDMEYLGIDNPVGAPSTTSILSGPASVLFADGTTENITLDVIDGNVGVLVSSMEITGPDAADYTFVTGQLTNQLLNASAAHTISIALSATTGANRNAVLTVNYRNGESIAIDLTNFDSNLNVTNPGTQNNNEGDVVSLQIQANGASTYTATGLPPTLTIDANTGLISGTVSAGGANNGPFLEQAGLVIIEAESGVIDPTWTQTTTGGATGLIAGTNHLGLQNGGTIPYQITVGTPGVYRFDWRNFYSGSNPTEENDNWLKFPNNADVWYFGLKGTPPAEAAIIANVTSATPTDIVFPIGSGRGTAANVPEGNGGNGYFKIYRSGGTSEVYDWSTFTSDNDGHNIYVYFVNAGTYTMELSERSAGHAIDKMALHKVDGTNYTDAQLTAAPESPRSGGGGAADGSPYTVTVSVSDNGAPPVNANTQFIWNIGEAGDPIAIATADPTSGFIPLDVDFTGSTSTDDVGIVSYLWDFGDGSPTSNLPDPTHTFTTVGSYNVQLTVEDANGTTNTTDVTINATDPAGAGTIRINSGGPTYTFDGVDWNLDQHFVGGDDFINAVPIANTANDELYQTERFNSSGTLTYEIPVVNGNYNLNLHFAELFYGLPGLGSGGGVGSRVFDINIENSQETINNYDIYVAAGSAAGTAVIEDFSNIVVTDGSLTVTLTGVEENPKISGIEVIIPGGNSAPVVYAGEDQNITLTNAALDGSATDADGGGIASYVWTQESGPSTATFSTTTSDDTVVSDLVSGTYVFRVTAADEEGDTGFDEVTITIDGEPGSLLINSGGPSITFGLEEWTADQHFMGGATFSNVTPIANTTNDELYQTERFNTSGTLVYEIPLALAGDYNVDLHFAELFFGIGVNGGGAGSRVFNIDIENSQVQINNYDIFVEAGDAATAIVESYKAINVTDGSLTITLTGVVENPKISGIGVFDTALPIADAGSDQTINLPTNTVTINGSGVDPDGGAIVSYLWTQESGPGGSATLTGDTTENLVASDLLAGDYVFRLTVTDDENTTGFDDVTITVVPEPGNEAPVAIASGTPLTGTAPLLVSFMGSSSTDDVAVTSYLWDFQDGNTSAEADPTHTFTTAGTFDVLLTVTDAGSLTDTATVTVVVSAAANEAPVAVATGTPLTGTAPLLVSFMGSDSTDDVEVTSYLWDFQDGNTSTEADPSNTFTTAGTYNVLLTVTDAEGLTDNETVIVVVNDATNQAPTAIIAANPITGEAGLVVTFDASNSEDDIAVTSYLWDFGDGSAMSTEEIIEHTYVSIGSYTATLTVEDAEGLSSTASIIITVTDENGNMPPVAIAEVEILSGLLVDLTGSNSTSSIGDLNYSWDFGDGSDPSTEADLEYLYQLSGTYTVTLTVTDENGITDQDTIEITVDKQGVDIEVRFAVNPPQKGSDVANIIFDNLPDNVTVKNITVHDIGGRYIGGYSLPAPLNGIKLTNYDIPIFDLQSGLYLVRVILSNDETVLVKLLINN